MPPATHVLDPGAEAGEHTTLEIDVTELDHASPGGTDEPTVLPLDASVTDAANAWTTAFGADPEFWLEEQFGHRICAWVDQVLSNDAKAFGAAAMTIARSRHCMSRPSSCLWPRCFGSAFAHRIPFATISGVDVAGLARAR